MHIFFWWDGYSTILSISSGAICCLIKIVCKLQVLCQIHDLQIFYFSQLPALNSGFRRIKVLLLLNSNLLILFFNSSCFCVLFKNSQNSPILNWLDIQEGRDICMPMSNSCWCMAKAITILLSNYLPIKINKFKNQMMICVSLFWTSLSVPIIHSWSP